ncbi:MFS transporter [Paeniglutamicibacter gangotriensis]|nr:MFS transporter [Paeniglutamicibacter gangotriensis]
MGITGGHWNHRWFGDLAGDLGEDGTADRAPADQPAGAAQWRSALGKPHRGGAGRSPLPACLGLSISSLIAQTPASTGYGIALPVFWAGFVMFPLSVGSFTANRIVRRLATRISLTALLPIGAGVVAASGTMLWFAHTQLWEILLGMLLFGLGMGASYAAMSALIARSVATEELGSSASFNQVLRTVGSSFGTAIAGAVLAANMGPDMHSTDTGITLTLAIGAILCLVVFAARSSTR